MSNKKGKGIISFPPLVMWYGSSRWITALPFILATHWLHKLHQSLIFSFRYFPLLPLCSVPIPLKKTSLYYPVSSGYQIHFQVSFLAAHTSAWVRKDHSKEWQTSQPESVAETLRVSCAGHSTCHGGGQCIQAAGGEQLAGSRSFLHLQSNS